MAGLFMWPGAQSAATAWWPSPRPLADKDRSDRVIAERWDASFALLDGEAGAADIERLRAQVPLQEKGRVSRRELVLSRANKSVRMFEYVCALPRRGAATGA